MIYEHQSYKLALKELLLQKQANVSKTFTFQNMAKACRVQKTYLSRVFNGQAHLSDDQLYLASEYLGFSEDERQYLSLLHQYERSCVQPKRRALQRRIEGVRKRHLMTDAHLKAAVPTVETQDFAAYYLDPNMQLVHMYLTVPRYGKDVAAIRTQLGLPEAEVTRILTKLQQLSLVVFVDGRYELAATNLHLPSDSPVYKPYRTLLRMKAMERLGTLTAEEQPYNFSVVFSANEDVRRRVQSRFLAFLKDVEAEVKDAEATDVYYMSFDLFPWSTKRGSV